MRCLPGKEGAAKLQLYTWHTNTTPHTLKPAWELAVLFVDGQSRAQGLVMAHNPSVPSKAFFFGPPKHTRSESPGSMPRVILRAFLQVPQLSRCGTTAY